MSDLAIRLRYLIGEIVVDKTGITGRYDVALEWTPDNIPADSAKAGGPSMFTALQEQLGLKLERSTVLVDILVIDSVEKPADN